MVMKLLEKDLQKINQQKFRTEKVIKKRGDKLHVKWKGYDSSFNNRGAIRGAESIKKT